MGTIERERIIMDWIAFHHAAEDAPECEKLRWAEQALSNLSYENPIICLDLILEIIKIDSTDKVIEGLAAGVIEDMLIDSGTLVIGRFEELALTNPVFKKLLGGVWLDDDVPSPIASRFEAIRGEHW